MSDTLAKEDALRVMQMSPKSFPAGGAAKWFSPQQLRTIASVLDALHDAQDDYDDPNAEGILLSTADMPVFTAVSTGSETDDEQLMGWIHQIDGRDYVFVPSPIFDRTTGASA